MAKPWVIVGIGEVLWDIFPDGAHFGGAPANFACSAAELGGHRAEVYVVGAVGRDELGNKAIELLRLHGVDTTYVSAVNHPTGQVIVTLDGQRQPSFGIAQDTAWDHVCWTEELEGLAGRADAVCSGTLAQRSLKTRETIRRFVVETRPECLRILDINLRPPFWSEQVVKDSLELANVLKLNDSELATLADSGSAEDSLKQLLNEFALDLIALTRGGEGALLVHRSGVQSHRSAIATEVVDTVGAGDAFTAALAVGMLKVMPLDAMNEWANRVASFVCTQPGATPRFPVELSAPTNL